MTSIPMLGEPPKTSGSKQLLLRWTDSFPELTVVRRRWHVPFIPVDRYIWSINESTTTGLYSPGRGGLSPGLAFVAMNIPPVAWEVLKKIIDNSIIYYRITLVRDSSNTGHHHWCPRFDLQKPRNTIRGFFYTISNHCRTLPRPLMLENKR